MQFEEMFKRIDVYQSQLGHAMLDMKRAERTEYRRSMALGLFMEVAELVDSTPWKPWRPEKDQTMDLGNAQIEIVDCLFFLVGIARSLGIDGEDIVQTFEMKLTENYARIKSGYNHTDGLKRLEEPVEGTDY